MTEKEIKKNEQSEDTKEEKELTEKEIKSDSADALEELLGVEAEISQEPKNSSSEKNIKDDVKILESTPEKETNNKALWWIIGSILVIGLLVVCCCVGFFMIGMLSSGEIAY